MIISLDVPPVENAGAPNEGVPNEDVSGGDSAGTSFMREKPSLRPNFNALAWCVRAPSAMLLMRSTVEALVPWLLNVPLNSLYCSSITSILLLGPVNVNVVDLPSGEKRLAGT